MSRMFWLILGVLGVVLPTTVSPELVCAKEPAVLSFEGVKPSQIYVKSVKRLTSGVRFDNMDWAPDSRYLLATEEKNKGLWLVDAATGATRRLSGSHRGSSRSWPMAWSPNGGKAVYVAGDGLVHLLAFSGVDLMTAKVRRKAVGRIDGLLVELLWGKQHGRLYWRDPWKDPAFKLIGVVDVDSTTGVSASVPEVGVEGIAVVVRNRGVIRRVAARGYNPRIELGERVLYAVSPSTDNAHFFDCDFDGGRRARRVTGKESWYPVRSADSSCSPDGTFSVLAFEGDEGTPPGFYVICADRSIAGYLDLGGQRVSAHQPRWAPDGRTLACIQYKDGSIALLNLGIHGGDAK